MEITAVGKTTIVPTTIRVRDVDKLADVATDPVKIVQKHPTGYVRHDDLI